MTDKIVQLKNKSGDNVYPLGMIGNCADYIVEQGTSGIWTYEKWNSGKAVFYGKTSNTISYSSAWGTMYYATAASSVSFPFALTDLKYVNASISDTSGNGMTMLRNVSNSSIGVIYALCPTAAQNVASTIYIEAKGRWK